MGKSRQTKADLEQDVAALRRRISELEQTLAGTGDLPRITKTLAGNDGAFPFADSARAIAKGDIEPPFPIPVMLSHIDRNLCFRFNSYRNADWNGKGSRNLEGRHMREVLGDRLYDEIAPHVESALSGEEQTFEMEVAGPAGDRRTLQVRYMPREGMNGALDGFDSAVLDVTEGKRAQARLLERESAFRELIEGSIQGIGIISTQRTLVFANQAYADIFGYDSPEQVVGMKTTAFIAPDQLPRMTEIYRARLRGEEPGNRYEYRGLRKDGTVVWIDRLMGRTTWAGRPAFLATFVDISERKRAEEEVRASERKFRDLVDGSIEGIAIIQEHRLCYTNQALADILGFADPSQIIGRNTLEMFVAPEDRYRLSEQHAARLRGEPVPDRYEFRGIRQDGQEIWLEGLGKRVAWDGAPAAQTTFIDITERRRAEAELRESEQKYRQLVDGTLQGIAIIQQHQILYANQAFAEIFGYSNPSEVIGQNSLELYVAPHEREQIDQRHQARMRGEQPVERFEFEGFRKDGEQIWLDVQVKMVTWEGQPAAQCALLDITDRKRAEQESKEAAQKYAALVDGSIQGITIIQDYVLKYANQALADIYGYGDVSELIGQDTLGRFIAPHERERIAELHAARLRGEPVPERYEFQGVRKDGVPIWLEGVARRVQWEGRPAAQVTYIDITERKRAEQDLRGSEERLRGIVDYAPMVAILKDRNLRYRLVNRRFEDMYGFTNEEVQGKTIEEFFEPEMAEFINKQEREVLRTGQLVEGELEVTDKHGNKIPSITTKFPVWDDGRNIVGVGTFTVDISQYKLLESQLRQSQKLQALGTLAGGIAHDFNNILHPILGYAQLLEEEAVEGSDERTYLGAISASAKRARDMISQILLFGRRGQASKSTCDVAPVVREVVGLARSTFPKTITIREVLPAVPQLVSCDPSQIHQGLLNLCVNARQAIPDVGEIVITVEPVELDGAEMYAGLPLSGDHVRLTVSDTGMGMSPETLSHLFEPFFSTKGIGEGTGLGLSTLFGIVQEHRGGIQVVSAPGAGATFRVYLPRVGHSAMSSEAGEEAVAQGSERILLIDDEPEIVTLSKIFLERLGYSVTATEDSRFALETFRTDPARFDLVVTDQSMPHMKGETLAREIRRMHPAIPIILCTGHSDSMNADISKAMGLNAFLYKPVEPGELGRLVRKVLDEAAT